MMTLKLLSMLMMLLFTPPAQRPTSDISFCQFDMPEVIKRANASFNVTYKFNLDSEGKPTNITKIRDDYVGEDKVKSCLERWRFRGLPSEVPMAVIFRWEHAKGWVEVSVAGPDFSQKIRLEGDGCPYRKSEGRQH